MSLSYDTVRTRAARAARGAGAGIVATLAMSAVQWPNAIAGTRRPPPVEVTRRVSRWLPGRNRKGADLIVRATLAHLAFGAMAGAIYGALAPRRQQVVTGVGYAGVIWGTSYLGYLPALHLMPPPSEDDPRVKCRTPSHTWSSAPCSVP